MQQLKDLSIIVPAKQESKNLLKFISGIILIIMLMKLTKILMLLIR
jgi:uncharacterized membrane protein